MLSQENEVIDSDPTLSRRFDWVPSDLNWPVILCSSSSFLSLVLAAPTFFLCRGMWTGETTEYLTAWPELPLWDVKTSLCLMYLEVIFTIIVMLACMLNCICISTRTAYCGWCLSPSCHQLLVYVTCIKKIAFLIMLITKKTPHGLWDMMGNTAREQLSRKKEETQSFRIFFFLIFIRLSSCWSPRVCINPIGT